MTEAFKNINPFILGLLISLGIGLILGLEREYDKLKEEQGFAGIRTFPIVAIIGFILGNLSTTYTPWLVIIIAAAFLLFLSLSHLSIVQKHLMTGITTNMALFTTLVLGVMVANHLQKEAVATAVVVVTLLSLKTTFNTFIKNITSEELFAFIKFSIIALLILPFLPNQDYGPEGLLNPFEIGAIIVIVSFLNFIGYFLVKYVGSKRGILLTAILGGLISSTAVAWIYASRSKESPELSKEYAAGIIIGRYRCDNYKYGKIWVFGRKTRAGNQCHYYRNHKQYDCETGHYLFQRFQKNGKTGNAYFWKCRCRWYSLYINIFRKLKK